VVSFCVKFCSIIMVSTNVKEALFDHKSTLTAMKDAQWDDDDDFNKKILILYNVDYEIIKKCYARQPNVHFICFIRKTNIFIIILSTTLKIIIHRHDLYGEK
jgi:hypothetical protein